MERFCASILHDLVILLLTPLTTSLYLICNHIIYYSRVTLKLSFVMSVFSKAVNYFSKRFHLRCLTWS